MKDLVVRSGLGHSGNPGRIGRRPALRRLVRVVVAKPRSQINKDGVSAEILPAQQSKAPSPPAQAPIANFTDIAEKAGLTMQNIFGGVDTKKYIIETTGTGVAIFDYNQRGAADEKLADLLVKKKSIHFLQIVKEPMPEPAPVEAVLQK